MTHHLRTALTSATLLTLTLGLTGCSPHPAAIPSGLPSGVGHSQAPLPTYGSDDSDIGDEPARSPDTTTDQTPAAPVPLLTQIWLADPPPGSGPVIALRFLQALQRDDDVNAGMQLHIFNRQAMLGRDDGFLHRVMNDVRKNARLAQAGPCTTARRLSSESAVVTCGRQHVVVHVVTDMSNGVQLGGWLTHHDVYRGPHSHAYNTLDQWNG